MEALRNLVRVSFGSSTAKIFNTNIPNAVDTTPGASETSQIKNGYFISKSMHIVPTNGLENHVLRWLGDERCDPLELGKILVEKLGVNHPNTRRLVADGHAIIDQDKAAIKAQVLEAHDYLENHPEV